MASHKSGSDNVAKAFPKPGKTLEMVEEAISSLDNTLPKLKGEMRGFDPMKQIAEWYINTR